MKVHFAVEAAHAWGDNLLPEGDKDGGVACGGGAVVAEMCQEERFWARVKQRGEEGAWQGKAGVDECVGAGGRGACACGSISEHSPHLGKVPVGQVPFLDEERLPQGLDALNVSYMGEGGVRVEVGVGVGVE